MDYKATVICNIFDQDVILLFPTDPVQKKRKDKHPFYNIVETKVIKEGKCVSGIDLH